MSERIIIVGAGASGLMAAGFAARCGAEVTLIERNGRVGRKLMITGKGRCNVTNNCTMLNELIGFVPVNGRFLFSAFSQFMPADAMELFESLGVELKVERGDRVFPVSDKAADIVDALHHFAFSGSVKKITGRVTELVLQGGRLCGVKMQDGQTVAGNKVIVATGGLSYPLTGSTGDGYELAKQAGHTVTTLKPSLVPLECHEGFCSDLQGLSLRNVSLKVLDAQSYRQIFEEFGEMLFTHFGVSGPIVLSASSHMQDMQSKKYELHIDLKPALSFEQLDKRVQRDFSDASNKNFINALDSLLPKKLVPVMVRLCGVKPSLKTNQVTREQRLKLVSLCKDLKLTVTGFRPIEEAIITSGGVDVKQIDPKTMESKLLPGLYFAGEVLDVDAYTGGFNLQIAFSTGRLAGISSAKRKE